MRKAIMQAVVECVVLAATMGVDAANYNGNNYPNDLVINTANPRPFASAGLGYTHSHACSSGKYDHAEEKKMRSQIAVVNY